MCTLGEKLIDLRMKRNLLQKDIAKETGIPLRSYQAYESNENDPTSKVIIKICKYFNVSSDYLLGLIDEERKIN